MSAVYSGVRRPRRAPGPNAPVRRAARRIALRLAGAGAPVYGADVSEFQSGLPGGDFVIIRAHSGYRPDKLFAQHWREAKGRYRLGRGVYGYVVNRDGVGQAQAMLDLVADDPPELGYWSDVEEPGLSGGVARAHIDHLRSTRKAGFYANVPDFFGILDGGAGLEDLPWWVAGYSSNDGTEHPLNPAPPRGYLIHQFTSRWGGASLDGNVADAAALLATFGGQAPPIPQPKKHRRNRHMIFVINDGKGEVYQYVGGPANDRASYIRLYGAESLVNHDHGSPVVNVSKDEFKAFVEGKSLTGLGARGWSF